MFGGFDMELNAEALQSLASLRGERKFLEDDLYPGAPDEATRVRCEVWANELLDTLLNGLPSNPNSSYVLSQFVTHLERFEEDDTEERERACGYCEQIMGILSIESSQGILDRWLYGFDPGEEP